MKKAAILAAGLGSRLRSISPFKPIVNIYGLPLLELTFNNLHFHQFSNVHIIFNDEEREMDLSALASLKQKNANYFFKSTPSSMHSLYEVSLKLDLKPGEHFFVSMVDSIVRPDDALRFHQFAQQLAPHESALLVTSFIEDEKPLTLKINNEGIISEFQCPLEKDVLITSGVYYFSADVLPVLKEMIDSGQTKLRNFLTELVLRHHKIKTFQVTKTLDIDRPEDIHSAEAFLGEILL